VGRLSDQRTNASPLFSVFHFANPKSVAKTALTSTQNINFVAFANERVPKQTFLPPPLKKPQFQATTSFVFLGQSHTCSQRSKCVKCHTAQKTERQLPQCQSEDTCRSEVVGKCNINNGLRSPFTFYSFPRNCLGKYCSKIPSP